MDQFSAIDRIDYQADLEPVITRLCTAYNVGRLQGFSTVDVGFEDCNVAITTDKGKFLAKMFAKTRTLTDIQRYKDIMQRVIAAGVHHPALVSTNTGDLIFTDSGVTLVLMQFIEGATFFAMDRVPSDLERAAIIEEAAKVNRINYKPPHLFDSWAIPNIVAILEKVRTFIAPDDLALVEQAVTQYQAIPVEELPHALVHGDFTKANVIKGDDGKIYVIDFSVTNWYPRIQELAVIAANLLHESEGGSTLRERCHIVAEEYNRHNPLTPTEREHLYAYALAGVAMEFLGSHQENFIKGNTSPEVDYWLKLGREGLKQALGK